MAAPSVTTLQARYHAHVLIVNARVFAQYRFSCILTMTERFLLVVSARTPERLIVMLWILTLAATLLAGTFAPNDVVKGGPSIALQDVVKGGPSAPGPAPAPQDVVKGGPS
jgi:hypothetical protein